MIYLERAIQKDTVQRVVATYELPVIIDRLRGALNFNFLRWFR